MYATASHCSSQFPAGTHPPIGRSAFTFAPIPMWAWPAVDAWLEHRVDCGPGARCPNCNLPANAYWLYSDGKVIGDGGYLSAILQRASNADGGTERIIRCGDCGVWAVPADGSPHRLEVEQQPAAPYAEETITIGITPNGPEIICTSSQGGDL